LHDGTSGGASLQIRKKEKTREKDHRSWLPLLDLNQRPAGQGGVTPFRFYRYIYS